MPLPPSFSIPFSHARTHIHAHVYTQVRAHTHTQLQIDTHSLTRAQNHTYTRIHTTIHLRTPSHSLSLTFAPFCHHPSPFFTSLPDSFSRRPIIILPSLVPFSSICLFHLPSICLSHLSILHQFTTTGHHAGSLVKKTLYGRLFDVDRLTIPPVQPVDIEALCTTDHWSMIWLILSHYYQISLQ